MADEKKLFSVVSGRSMATGFKLRVVLENQDLFFYSRAYEEKSISKISPWLNLLTTSIIFVLLTLVVKQVVVFKGYGFFFSGMVLLWCVSVFIRVFGEFFFLKETREWHSLEHKSSRLLEKRLESTVEALKSLSGVLNTCGTCWLVNFGQLLICFWVVIGIWSGSILFLSPGLTNLILLASCFIWFGSLFFAMVAFLGFSWPMNLFTFILCPAAILPLLTEKLVALKKPSENKIAQTAEDLKIFINEYNLYGGDSF